MTTISELPLNTPTKIEETADIEVWATRTVNGGTFERRPKAGGPTANQADLNAKLVLLLSEAAAAITSLQTIRDRADLAAGTLSSAVLSNAARQLQADSKTQARLSQETIKRVVAIARLASGAVDSVSDT